MLFLLRDGFLSSIGQQNVSVIYEQRSVWLHPPDPALRFNTNAWKTVFFIKVPPTPNKSESYSRRETIYKIRYKQIPEHEFSA